MAGCITGNTGEHLHPRSPLKTRICNVASRKTHLCTHTQAQTDTAVCQMLVRTWSFYWHVYISHNTLKAHAYTHTHTNTTKGVNSGDFPCQLLSRHWFKETSICDVSTYLMNPLRSMEALVCYTVRLHCLACFYVYCDSFGIHVGLGQNMSRCVCVCVCDRACMMLYNWKKSLLINHLFFECICILN